MKGASEIFSFLLTAQDRGEGTALVTLTDVIGSSSRAPGTHMGVSEAGASIGSFSGGCVEAAVIAEARRVIGDGTAERVRFGAGSPFIDVRLPCGGGIDLLITPDPDTRTLRTALELLERREPVTLRLGLDGTMQVVGNIDADQTGLGFLVRHEPDLRILILGHGAEVVALARIATTYGALVEVFTPDETLTSELERAGIAHHPLSGPKSVPGVDVDGRTAIVFLFHDHDWEPDLLAWALGQQAVYVGAMGSQATHANRLEGLAAQGVPSEAFSKLIGPIGIIRAARDPETLALSVLAQVVDTLRNVN